MRGSRALDIFLAAEEQYAIVFTEALTHGSEVNRSGKPRRTLYFDPVTYTCKGDPEATAMFTRQEYRSPFTVTMPAYGVSNPTIVRSSVVLPAPFGPMTPRH